MKTLKYLFGLIVLCFGVTFAALNAQPVTLNYYAGAKTLSLALLLGWALALGALLGWLLGSAKRAQLKLANYQAKQRLKQLEKQLKISSEAQPDDTFN